MSYLTKKSNADSQKPKTRNGRTEKGCKSFYLLSFGFKHEESSTQSLFSIDPCLISLTIAITEIINGELVADFIFLKDSDDVFLCPCRQRIYPALFETFPNDPLF